MLVARLVDTCQAYLLLMRCFPLIIIMIIFSFYDKWFSRTCCFLEFYYSILKWHRAVFPSARLFVTSIKYVSIDEKCAKRRWRRVGYKNHWSGVVYLFWQRATTKLVSFRSRNVWRWNTKHFYAKRVVKCKWRDKMQVCVVTTGSVMKIVFYCSLCMCALDAPCCFLINDDRRLFDRKWTLIELFYCFYFFGMHSMKLNCPGIRFTITPLLRSGDFHENSTRFQSRLHLGCWCEFKRMSMAFDISKGRKMFGSLEPIEPIGASNFVFQPKNEITKCERIELPKNWEQKMDKIHKINV